MASVKLLGSLNWSMDFDIGNGQFEGFSINVPDQEMQAEFSYYNEQDEEQMITVKIPIRSADVEIDINSHTGTFKAVSMNLAPKSILWDYDSALVNFQSM